MMLCSTYSSTTVKHCALFNITQTYPSIVHTAMFTMLAYVISEATYVTGFAKWGLIHVITNI